VKVREKKKLDTKNKILSTALRLFEEKGFEGTTVLEIAVESGVSRGTFFNYFPYKEALLVEYLSEYLIGLSGDLDSRYSHDSAVKAIYHLADDFAGFANKNKHLVLPLCYELLNPDPERSKQAYLALPLVPIIGNYVDWARANKIMRQDHSSERLARTIANSIFLTSLHWASYRQHLSINKELKTTLDLLLEGLLVDENCE